MDDRLTLLITQMLSLKRVNTIVNVLATTRPARTAAAAAAGSIPES